MPMRALLGVSSSAAVALALLPGVATANDGVDREPASAVAQNLTTRVATNWRHEPGHPASGTPGHRITGAAVEIRSYDNSGTLFIDTAATLGTPSVPSDDPAGLAVQFGHWNSARACVGAAGAIEWSDTLASTRSHRLTGSTPSSWGPAPSKPWECVRVLRAKNDQSLAAGFHDVLVGTLPAAVARAPRLKVGRTSVLGQNQKVLKVAPGGWTPVEVAISNVGTAKAGKVTVRGVGRGLKVKPGSLRSISDGTTHRALVKVKPAGRKKPRRLKLVARAAGGVVAERTVRIKQVRQPKRAAAGKYRGAKGRVTFTVSKGKVAKFRIRTLTRCNGYGNVADVKRNTYAFPKRAIPRNGILHASAKGKGWSAHLQFRAVGTKVTRGTFRYYGPGGCVAAERFAAKRAGR